MIAHPHLHLPVARAGVAEPCGRPGHHALTVAAGLLVTVGAAALGYTLATALAGFWLDAALGAGLTVASWTAAVVLTGVHRRREERRDAFTREWHRRDAEAGIPRLRLVHGFREAK